MAGDNISSSLQPGQASVHGLNPAHGSLSAAEGASGACRRGNDHDARAAADEESVAQRTLHTSERRGDPRNQRSGAEGTGSGCTGQDMQDARLLAQEIHSLELRMQHELASIHTRVGGLEEGMQRNFDRYSCFVRRPASAPALLLPFLLLAAWLAQHARDFSALMVVEVRVPGFWRCSVLGECHR